MAFDRARREPVGDNERHVVTAIRVRRQRRIGLRRQLTSEVGTHQILRAITHRTGDHEHGRTERRQIGAEARLVEPRMHGVAGARMGEAELEQ